MQNSKNIIKLTNDLIRFESTKANFKEKKEIVQFVEKQFKGHDVYIKRFEKNGTHSIVVTLKKERNPKIFLSGHLDVVDAKKSQFQPKIKNNRIYGRGSGDMKAGCAAMIEAIKFFSSAKSKPSLGLMLTTDEEIGGANGVGYILDHEKYHPDVVIVPDGGIDLRTIVTDQKGVIHLKLISHGISAHGARPFLGKNAIEKLIDFYSKIRRNFSNMDGEWKNTINLGKFIGGESVNKVPDYAEMHLDIRYIRANDRDRILNYIEKISGDIVIEVAAQGEVFVQNKKNSYVKAFKKIIENKLDEKVHFYKVEGASDARYFSKKGIATIITKIKCENIHANDEWVDVKEIQIFYNCLIEFIESCG
ncbi:MAG TPA: hypothetical protein DIC35_01025 [Candidatus Moranbacteria bacterium]|nr:hypothetical protein [Candidatus Moranbacteria bacterium]